MEYLSRSASQTKRIGKDLAKHLLKKHKSGPLVVGLEGDLGGGKTTFLQGFAEGLGIKEKILSPTFIIMRAFQIPKSRSSSFSRFYHIDCYRVKKPKELSILGFGEIVADPKNIVAIEWAGRVKRILPKNMTSLKFKFVGQNSRKIIISQEND